MAVLDTPPEVHSQTLPTADYSERNLRGDHRALQCVESLNTWIAQSRAAAGADAGRPDSLTIPILANAADKVFWSIYFVMIPAGFSAPNFE